MCWQNHLTSYGKHRPHSHTCWCMALFLAPSRSGAQGRQLLSLAKVVSINTRNGSCQLSTTLGALHPCNLCIFMYNTHTMAESSFIRMPTFSRVKIIFPSWLSHRTFHGHCRLSLAPATSLGLEGIYTRSPVHQTTANLF